MADSVAPVSEKAWCDSAWFDTDGMAIVYAETEAEAREELRLDDGNPVTRVEAADGLGGMSEADRYSYLLMMGVMEVDSCINCSSTIYNPGNGSPLESDSGARPVRVDGVGFFCDLACLGDYSRRLHRMPRAWPEEF